MEKVTLKVFGMVCNACEDLLKESLEEIDGVKSAKASFKAAKVVVEYDPAKTDTAAMEKVIEKEDFSTTAPKKGENLEEMSLWETLLKLFRNLFGKS